MTKLPVTIEPDIQEELLNNMPDEPAVAAEMLAQFCSNCIQSMNSYHPEITLEGFIGQLRFHYATFVEADV